MVAEIPQGSGASEASVDDRGIAADVATRRRGKSEGKGHAPQKNLPKKSGRLTIIIIINDGYCMFLFRSDIQDFSLFPCF